jgi:hypothetical protein
MPLRQKSSSAFPTRTNRDVKKSVGLDFHALVEAIQQVHQQSAATASRAVNTALTLRNWAIGFYIREYEQNGADRAKYGAGVIDKLAKRLHKIGKGELTARYLRLCRHFATSYPSIRRLVTANSQASPFSHPIWRSLTAKSTNPSMHTEETNIGEFHLSPETSLEALSFTHFEQLLSIADPLQRAFYELECIRGHWSVRDLKRQIATLYFERSGLSKDKEKLAAMAHKSRPEGPKSYSPVHRAGFTRQNTPRAESPGALPFASRETRIPPCRALSGRSFTGTNFPALRTGLKNFAPSVHFEFPAPIATHTAKEGGTGVPPVMADMAPHQLPFNTTALHGRDGRAPFLFSKRTHIPKRRHLKLNP